MEVENKKHISYEEYQNKSGKTKNDGIVIFVSAFFILLLLFLGIAKQISPDVDVSIGDDENASSETIGIDKNVDERLKLLKMEDESKSEDSMFAADLEEKVVLPEHKKDIEENKKEEIEHEATPKPEDTASPEPKATIQEISKVVIGYYSTKEQAEVAKGIISESGLNISPFVRQIGGAYTIQVGSFSSRDKAQILVNELLRNNYPARIINE